MQNLGSWSCQQHLDKQWHPWHHLSPSSSLPGFLLSFWTLECRPQKDDSCLHLHTHQEVFHSCVKMCKNFLWLCFVYKMSSLNNNSPDFIVVELFHGILSLFFCGEGNKCIASIVAIEVHHHPYFVNFAKLQRQVSVTVLRLHHTEISTEACLYPRVKIL